MNRLFTFIFLFCMTLSASAQSLTPRLKHLATVAALQAQGDMVRLEPAVRTALDNGISINELKETFSHLYAYTGFPRSLNALGILERVVKTNNGQWQEGKPWTRPAEWDDAKKAYESGVKVQTELGGGRAFEYLFCPQDNHYLRAHLFGDIFAGDQLTHAEREIVTVAALSALKGVPGQLAAHKGGAVNMGNSQETIDELCKFLSQNGLSQNDSAADANAGSWPKGNPNDAYAQYFMGNSYLAPLPAKNLSAGEKSVQSYANVTFEPACRNNWHVHHGVRQILICVSGEGLYQEWGKAAIRMKAGDIIEIPEDVKHWHGATATSWFQHVVTHVKTGVKETNEWLEAVTDEQFAEANK